MGNLVSIGEVFSTNGNHGNLQAKKIKDSSVRVSRLTIEEMNEIPAFLTLSQIEQYGFLVEAEPPEPVVCPYCNKKLYFSGARSLYSKIIVRWKSEPERCGCMQSVKHWKEIEAAKDKAEAERKQKEEQEALKARVEKLFSASKMGERFKARTFENFRVGNQNEKAFKAVRNYSEKFREYADQGIGFMLSGPYGSGKTHLAAALAIDLINKGNPVVFSTLSSLLGRIRQTYSDKWKQDDELELVETYSTVKLLIIDDIGKEAISSWALEKLFTIVNSRYENNLPIVITTNYSLDSLIEKLTVNNSSDIAESIVSRLHEMCRGIYLNAPDHRKVKE